MGKQTYLREVLVSVFVIHLLFFSVWVSSSWADPLDNWHWRSPLPQGNSLNGVTYANGIFVAVGDLGTILTSPDGVSWTQRRSGTTYNLNAVTYGNGIFVAGGETILVSSDGMEWVEIQDPAAKYPLPICGIAYGNGIFVAVRGGWNWDNVILTSTDGLTWSEKPFEKIIGGVGFGKGIFVVVGDDTVLTSPDGVMWTESFPGNYGRLTSVSYANGTFIAVSQVGAILSSPDGVTWQERRPTQCQSSGCSFLFAVTSGGGKFVAVGSNGTLLISPEGETWEERSSGTSNDLLGIFYGNGIFVTVGAGGIILTSPDGETWTKRISGTPHHLYGITYGNGTFVAVGDGVILNSPDGVVWEESTLGTIGRLWAVTFGKGLFVAVGDVGTILTSSDGTNWIQRNSGTTHNLNGVVYGNGIFVVVGEVTLTSPDGVAWTETNSAIGLKAVAYGNGNFVAIACCGIFVSTDGVAWTYTFDNNVYTILEGVAYGNGTFVVVGMSGEFLLAELILTSPDGVTWTQKRGGPGFYRVFYENGLFIGTGFDAFLISTDGVAYEAILETSNYLTGIAYGAATFVAVGEYGTILQSDPLIEFEVISTPDTPAGPINATLGKSYSYSTGGSSSTLGDPLQYLFDWGDATDSGWLPVGQTSVSKSWAKAGVYIVTAKARCALHTSLITWSKAILVNVSSIELQTPPNNSHFNACSLHAAPDFTWSNVNGIFDNYEIHFSLNSYFVFPYALRKEIPGSSTEFLITLHDWKGLLSKLGGGGGTIYWRIWGLRALHGLDTSEIRSIIVDPPQSVGTATVSPTSKNSLPKLSWDSSCNEKFKVWFGSDESFSEKKGFSFNVRNPNDNDGRFTKGLTSGQWKAIRKLVGDASGATVYWYVESWDEFRRYAKTEVMSFVLTD